MPNINRQQRVAVAIVFVLIILVAQFIIFFSHNGFSTVAIVITGLIGFWTAPHLIKTRNPWQGVLLGGMLNLGAYVLGSLTEVTFRFILTAPEGYTLSGFIVSQNIFYIPLSLYIQPIPIIALSGMLAGLFARSSVPRNKTLEAPGIDAKIKLAEQQKFVIAFAFMANAGVAQLLTFAIEPIQILGLPICMVIAWHVGYRVAPWILERRSYWLQTLIGGITGLSIYALGNLILGVPRDLLNTAAGFDDSRLAYILPIAGLLGLPVGSAARYFTRSTGNEDAARNVKLTAFLRRYMLYAFVSGVTFILLIGTTFDQEVALFPVAFFEVIGPAWVQLIIAVVAWGVKGIKKTVEVSVSSTEMRVLIWTIGGLQASYIVLFSPGWISLDWWSSLGSPLVFILIIVRFLFYVFNVALIVFLFRSPLTDASQKS